MSDDHLRDRLSREAEVYEQRLEHDIDALARSKPAAVVRAIDEHRDVLRIVALATAASVATLGLAYLVVQIVRRARRSRAELHRAATHPAAIPASSAASPR